MPAIKIAIELGNDAMRSGEDVASALRRAAGTLETFEDFEQRRGVIHVIRDVNGNRVGAVKIGGRS